MSEATAPWLRVQLDTDEEVIRAAVGRGAEWVLAERPVPQWGDQEDDPEILAGGKPILRGNAEYGGEFAAEHAILFDPKRMLAEVESKRLILDFPHAVERGG